MHVAEAADVHENVKAKALAGVELAQQLVMPATMAQPEIDDLIALRGCETFHYLANLAIGVVASRIDQGGCQLDLQRRIFHQIDHRRRLDPNIMHPPPAGITQFPPFSS